MIKTGRERFGGERGRLTIKGGRRREREGGRQQRYNSSVGAKLSRLLAAVPCVNMKECAS